MGCWVGPKAKLDDELPKLDPEVLMSKPDPSLDPGSPSEEQIAIARHKRAATFVFIASGVCIVSLCVILYFIIMAMYCHPGQGFNQEIASYHKQAEDCLNQDHPYIAAALMATGLLIVSIICIAINSEEH